MTSRVALAEVAAINPSTPQGVRARDGQRMVPFLPMSAVSEEGNVAYEESRPVSELLKGYTYFQRGDVLLAKITPCLENGKAASLSDLPDEFGFGSTEFHVLRPGPEIDPRYLFHSIWNNAFRHAASNSFTGSAGQKRLPASFFDRYRIPLPPLAEQRRIAANLDTADGIRRKRRESIKLLDEFLRSAFVEMFGDPVRNEKGWEVVPLGDQLADIESGWSPKCLDRSAHEGEWGVLKLGAITKCEYLSSENKALKEGDLPRPALEVKVGDLLMTRKNTADLVAACVYVIDTRDKLMIPDLVYRLQLKHEAPVLPAFLWQVLIHPGVRGQVQRLARGSAGSMPNISKGRLTAVDVPVPPRGLQQRFESLLLKTIGMKNALRALSNEDDRLFSSLAQRAFEENG